MSGGSWDYVYDKFEDAAHRLSLSPDPLRRAFSKHMHKVAKAMHDIEWVDSCDYGPGDDREAIEAVLGENATALEIKECRAEAEDVAARLQKLIEEIKGTKP